MGPRTAIVAGLASGAAVALAVLVAFVAFVPEPGVAAASPSAPTAPEPTASAGASSDIASTEPSATGTGDVGGVAVGQPAPPIRVPQLGGGEIDLANLRGQSVWIAFIASDCEACSAEVAPMNDFTGRYADAGLVVVAIDVGEDESLVATFVQNAGARFAIGLDLDGSAAAGWGVGELPVHVWLDPDGVVRFTAVGATSPEIMAEGVRAILPGVVVTP